MDEELILWNSVCKLDPWTSPHFVFSNTILTKRGVSFLPIWTWELRLILFIFVFVVAFSCYDYICRWMISLLSVRKNSEGRLVLSRHLRGGTKENNENLSQDNRPPGRDSNLRPRQYEAGEVATPPQPPVYTFMLVRICRPQRDKGSGVSQTLQSVM
jgi:hypothetical protein